jgi:hypothetical protein
LVLLALEFKDAFFDGTVTSDAFAGPLTGDVTGNVSGTAATVTTAAQSAITSVGTLTALQVDNININGNTISSTAGTDLNITPLAGQQIVLDGVINIDAGVVTGATSITSTAFVGALTGNADTATTLATARNINGVSFDGSAAITVTAAAGTLSGNTLNSSVVTSSLTSVDTIVTGVWNGTAIASAHLDADTAHLTTAQTFTGEKTFGTTTKLNFRDANAYINSPTANDIEIVATTITLDAASDIQLEGNTTVTGDFTVDGDFIVSGDVVTVNTATLSVEDPLIGMASGNGANSVDIGIWGKYTADGAKYTGLFRDASDSDMWKLFATTGNSHETPGTGTTINTTSGFTYANLTVATLTGDVTGDVTGNADTATVLATARTIGGVSFDGSADIDLPGVNSEGNQNTTGSAATLTTARAINGVNFDGSAAITVTAAAGTLSGNTLNSSVVTSSLTTVGTLATGNATAIVSAATDSAAGKVELATAAEVLTGTDAARVVTADTLSAKSVVATIVAGSLTGSNIVTITHDLGTEDVMVQLFDMATEANVYADIARTTADMSTSSSDVISIDFGIAPTNDIRCLITSLKGATAGTLEYE